MSVRGGRDVRRGVAWQNMSRAQFRADRPHEEQESGDQTKCGRESAPRTDLKTVTLFRYFISTTQPSSKKMCTSTLPLKTQGERVKGKKKNLLGNNKENLLL